MGALVIYLSPFLCLYLPLILIKFLNKVWWNPTRIQSFMRSQGIKGPSYRFPYGNTKEIDSMRNAIMSSPKELSYHTFPIVLPHIYQWKKLYGMNFLYWHGPRAQLVVTESELIKEVLKDKHGTYPKDTTSDFGKKLTGDGLAITTKPEKWSKHRKLANNAFHGENLKDMTAEMINSVEMMLERWRHYNGKVIDAFEEFQVVTSEIISRTAFGSSHLEGEDIFDMMNRMTRIVDRNFYKIKIPGIGKFFKTNDDIESGKLLQGIRDSIIKIIKKREEEANKGEPDSCGNDFLGLLIKGYHEKDKTNKISLDDLIDECKTFYFAGHATTSSALTWTVLLLAIHTDWQEKARNEVFELFGHHQNPSPDSFGRLKIMTMIVNESLRLFPPAVNIARKVSRQVRLGKLIVPANMEILISTLALHHDPQIWGQDAYLFKPERFAEGVVKATNDNIAAFFPFGIGPRTCVGSNFAIAETKIALSMILQRYKFTLSPTYFHSPFQSITTCPQHGLQIILQQL